MLSEIRVLAMLPWDDDAAFGFSVDGKVHIWELGDR